MVQQMEIYEKLVDGTGNCFQTDDYQTVAAVLRCMREYGIRDVSQSGWPQLHGVAVEDDSTISTRCISAAVEISQTSVWHLIQRL